MVIVALILLGLCFGSFVNATVWRLHEQAHGGKKNSAKRLKELSILQGRSMCVHCGHTLAWYDLLPLVSWLTLKGRCRYCHKPISWQYPLVEAATALLFIFSYANWPNGFHAEGLMLFSFWLVILTGLIALCIYDFKWMELPDRLTFPLAGIGIAQLLLRLALYHGGWSLLFQSILAIACLAGLFYLLSAISKGKWIGGGDIKLGIILGLLAANPGRALLLLFIASSLGSLAAIPGLLTKKLSASSKIPFGPFLIVAAIMVYLFGASILHWYTHQLLPQG